MEPTVLARIFEPFFSTKEVGKGMGLGLSLCHALVEALGGHIEIASTPNHGTTASVTIPYTAINAPTVGLATAKEDSHEYNATAHRGR
jgi:signal transduction histidine kinase